MKASFTPNRKTAAAILLAAAFLLPACASQWRHVRERPEGKAETLMKIYSVPSGAEISLDGSYWGKTPFEVKIRYPYNLRVYQRRTYFPYPHVEEKEVKSYTDNTFVFTVFAIGHERAEERVTLEGEETRELDIRLTPKRE